MKQVDVGLGARAYRITIGRGILRDVGRDAAEVLKPTGAALITHPGTVARWAEPVAQGFGAAGIRTTLITMPAGERHKTLRTVARLYGALRQAGIDRQGLVVTVGGGVVGDVGGFVAATYLRGIRFVQVPTTLLAQVDASVGGKTGVDLPEGKNLVGAFHQPSAVAIDPDTLATLPARQVRSGMAEIVKHGIISDGRLFARVRESASRYLDRGSAELEEAIVRSCEIKAQVVAADETERGLRAILNFGHTVGHAIETLTGYRRFLHGEAVSIGMVAAACIGEVVGVTPGEVRCALVPTLRALRLPVDLPADLSTEALLQAMSADKKSLGGRHRLVLAERIGSVRVVEDVRPDDIAAGLDLHRRMAGA